MIYRMPIDECPSCGARTPRIFRHRCLSQTENGHDGDQLAAELQAWIASQLAANSARTGAADAHSARSESDQAELDLSAAARGLS